MISGTWHDAIPYLRSLVGTRKEMSMHQNLKKIIILIFIFKAIHLLRRTADNIFFKSLSSSPSYVANYMCRRSEVLTSDDFSREPVATASYNRLQAKSTYGTGVPAMYRSQR